jgi:hypothetical protein
MLSESIVYGCIRDMADARVPDRQRVNREAMLALPRAESWPVLSREMFSLTDQSGTDLAFHTEVMHFGASYQGIEYEWKHWIEQFENLLRQMYWVSAVVHLETELSGNHSFLWEANGSCHRPGEDVTNVRCEWVHESWLSAG